MWAMGTGWREALSGTIDVSASAAVWLGAEVTVPDLVIQSGSVTQELAGDQIQTTVALTVADPDGTLFTGWGGSPIDVLGHRARITSTISAGGWSETVPVGTMRINRVHPQGSAQWRLYLKTGVWARPAQTLSLSCGDLLDQVASERFLSAPTPPGWGATIGAEVERLTAGIVPVGSSILTLTRAVPGDITYDDVDRLGTIVSLLRVDAMIPVVDRSGVLQAIPATGSGAQWQVPMDALITATPSADRAELRNGWVVTSETESREPLRGQSLAMGRLAWGGPFGRVPEFAHSPVLTTNSQCVAAAETNRAKDEASRRRPLTIECGIDPAVDVLDTAVVQLPTGPVPGLITRINRPLHGRIMTVDASVDWEALRG